MSLLVIFGGVFVTICGSIFLYDAYRAPEGFEDETGFCLAEAPGDGVVEL